MASGESYDISVVIPLYNNEAYIEDALLSVINQSYSLKKIEIIIIDDGSVDGGYDICEQYSKKYSNIVLLRNDKNGVSSARNMGMQYAGGKYIMLLDSDDYISKHAIKRIIEFYNRHEAEVGVVVYPFYSDRGLKIKWIEPKYKRYTKGTGIYDVEEYPDLSQTTINVVFPNDKKYQFDETLEYGEDQEFVTRLVMRTGKIGYVNNAHYYYRIHGGNVTIIKNSPYYIYDQIIRVYQQILNSSNKDGSIPYYLQYCILFQVRWRLNADKLFPDHLSGKEYDDELEKLLIVLRQIELPVWRNFKELDLIDKIYLMSLCGLKIDNNFIETDKVPVYLTLTKIRNGKLYIEGCVIAPEPDVANREFVMRVRFKGDYIDKPISPTRSDNSESIYNFEVETEDPIGVFEIVLRVDGSVVPLTFKDTTFSSANISNSGLVFRRYNDSGLFGLKKSNFMLFTLGFLRQTLCVLRKNPPAAILRVISIFIPRGKETWIYSDGVDGKDSGFACYKQDILKNDGVRRLYIKNENIDLSELNYATRKNILIKGSLRHYANFVRAKYIITSCPGIGTFAPYVGPLRYYYDLLSYEMIVV